MRYLLPILLALSACAPQRLNDGAQLPVTIIPPSDMAEIAGHKQGEVTSGAYRWNGALGEVFLLECGEAPWTFAHELRHAADRLGCTYAHVIELATPANPSPAFTNKLAVAWEIERAGGSWQAIVDRWGKDACRHPEILATLRIK